MLLTLQARLIVAASETIVSCSPLMLAVAHSISLCLLTLCYHFSEAAYNKRSESSLLSCADARSIDVRKSVWVLANGGYQMRVTPHCDLVQL